MAFLLSILEFIFPLRPAERHVKEASIDALFKELAPTIIPHKKFQFVALLPYHTPLVAAYIKEAKFHNNKKAFEGLSRVLGEYLSAHLEDADAFELTPFSIVPVPLSEKREKERGYNQTERICAWALMHLQKEGRPIRILQRVRDTIPQTTLRRALRIKNMKGAFKATDINSLCTYLVVDDVVTTGATLEAACEALMEAGAKRVIGIALAH